MKKKKKITDLTGWSHLSENLIRTDRNHTRAP